MRMAAAVGIAISLSTMAGCRTAGSQAYERTFYGPDFELAIARCDSSFARAEQLSVAAGPPVPGAIAGKPSESPLDSFVEAIGDALGGNRRRRECMTELGWKQIPAYNLSAQRGQPFSMPVAPSTERPASGQATDSAAESSADDSGAASPRPVESADTHLPARG